MTSAKEKKRKAREFYVAYRPNHEPNCPMTFVNEIDAIDYIGRRKGEVIKVREVLTLDE